MHRDAIRFVTPPESADNTFQGIDIAEVDGIRGDLKYHRGYASHLLVGGSECPK